MTISKVRRLLSLHSIGDLMTPKEFEANKIKNILEMEKENMRHETEEKEKEIKDMIGEPIITKASADVSVAGIEERIIVPTNTESFQNVEVNPLCDEAVEDFLDIALPEIDIDIDAIIIDDIRDEDGILSERICSFEDRANASVLPFEVSGIHQTTVHLKHHEIVVVNGKKCTSGLTRIIDKVTFNNFVKAIKDDLEQGKPFKCILNTTITHEGVEYPCLRFSVYELSWMKKYFSNYTFLFKKYEEDYILVIR